jgi:hypothetical protein
LQDDDRTSHHHDERQPKWEKAALWTVSAPADAETDSIEENDTAEKHQN